MEEWKEYKISEVIDEISMGPFGSNIKVDNFIDSGVPVLNGSNLQGFKLNEDSFNYVSQEKADSLGKANAHQGDVVITHRGTLGQIVYIPEESKFEQYVISQSQFRLKLKKDLIRPDFFVYFFHTRLGQHRIMMNASQVGVPALARPTSTFKEVCVPVPPMETQNKVMSILHSLDDKIEVNRRINDNLEQQAQALFKSWFVDFEPFKDGEFVESELGMIPKGWRVGKLGEICKCVLGGTPSRNKEEYWKGNIAWINSGEVNKFRITAPSEYITKEGLKHSATKLLPKKTTVLAITGATLGQVSLLEIDSCANQSVIGVLENEKVPYEFIFPLINERIKELISHMTGGAQQHINKNNVEQLDVIIPSEKAMIDYKRTISPIYSQIGITCFESRRLAELRDTLLPKLMSGELKVNEIDTDL